jgi:hypothetical protein
MKTREKAREKRTKLQEMREKVIDTAQGEGDANLKPVGLPFGRIT